MRACWLKWVGRDWSISADYIWLNYSGANSISPQLTNNWISSGTEISIELTARQEKGLFTTFNSRGPTIPAFSENWQAIYLRF